MTPTREVHENAQKVEEYLRLKDFTVYAFLEEAKEILSGVSMDDMGQIIYENPMQKIFNKRLNGTRLRDWKILDPEAEDKCLVLINQVYMIFYSEDWKERVIDNLFLQGIPKIKTTLPLLIRSTPLDQSPLIYFEPGDEEEYKYMVSVLKQSELEDESHIEVLNKLALIQVATEEKNKSLHRE